MAHDVFISYSSKDKTPADAVCAVLESKGIRCWIAPRDVLAGTPYGEAIIDAIHGAQAMVLIFSSHANTSGHIPKEVERAVSRGMTIIPVRIEDVIPAKSLDYFIGSVHWLDAMTPPLEAHLEKLARTVQSILPERSTERGARPSASPAYVLPAVTPQQPKNNPASVQKTGVKPAVIYGGLGVIVVALLVVILMLSSGSRENTASVTLPSAATTDRPEQPGQNLAAGTGNILGCWSWLNSAVLEVHSDGRVTVGPFAGRWRQVDAGRRAFAMTWPQGVDRVTLSPDGRRMDGSNQYGLVMSATRNSAAGNGLVGSWRWFNGAPVMINADGTLNAGPLVARWRQADSQGQTYTITWPEPVDSLTLSSDGQRLDGGNQFGVAVNGTRLPSCP